MVYHIIINPVAGRKKKHADLNFLQTYILKNNLHAKIYFTKQAGDPKVIASKIEEANPEGGTIIVCGGDGTLNETINSVKDLSKWTFGILPFGSGNDFATKLNIDKKHMHLAFNTILKGHVKECDYIVINDEMRCLNISGTGVDIDILHRFERYTKLHGSFRYLMATLVSLFKYKPEKYKAIIDEKEVVEFSPFIMAICNGSQFGGGIKMCVEADVSDNKLEFIYCKMIKGLKLFHYIPKLVGGTIHKTKIYKRISCENVELSRSDNQDFFIEVDGAVIKGNKFNFKIVKSGIKILC